jgi:hypothetical protein
MFAKQQHYVCVCIEYLIFTRSQTSSPDSASFLVVMGARQQKSFNPGIIVHVFLSHSLISSGAYCRITRTLLFVVFVRTCSSNDETA